LRHFVVAKCVFGVIMAHHAAAGGTGTCNGAAAVQQVGVPDEHVAPFGQKHFLFQVVFPDKAFDAVFVSAVAVGTNGIGRIARLVVGRHDPGQSMAAGIVEQRPAVSVNVFQCDPGSDEIPGWLGGHVDGVGVRALFAAFGEVERLKGHHMATQQEREERQHLRMLEKAIPRQCAALKQVENFAAGIVEAHLALGQQRVHFGVEGFGVGFRKKVGEDQVAVAHKRADAVLQRGRVRRKIGMRLQRRCGVGFIEPGDVLGVVLRKIGPTNGGEYAFAQAELPVQGAVAPQERRIPEVVEHVCAFPTAQGAGVALYELGEHVGELRG